MIEYLIAVAETTEQLQKQVIHWIKYGYKPQGGICVNPDTMNFLQAMIPANPLTKE